MTSEKLKTVEESDLGNKGLYKSEVDVNINIIIFLL